MLPDDIDAVQEAVEKDTNDALARHQAEQAAADRQARIDASFRPRVPDEERRCHGCDVLIGMARLKAQPMTGLCTSCASEAEMVLRQGWYP
jgi:RNA polymerase-binding transcription factor DksA